MAHRREPRRAEQWRERIERQQQSGLTIAEFTRREGVSPASFYAWKRKLFGPTGRACAASHRQVSRRPPAPQSAKPQVAQGTFLQVPIPHQPTSPWIELALADGTMIRIPEQNLAALQAVLHCLANPCQQPAVMEG